MLKKAILENWMNHHWLEKQKLRANRATFREASHQQESPSEYVIRKMELLTLVYSYTDTKTIQAIMMEVPGTWASIINPQYQKMLREFQNSIKYHEESLEKLEAPVLQPPCLPNREYTSACFPYHRANINLVGWSIFSTNRNANDIYTSPDSLILKTNPHLHVANFSASDIMVQIG